MTAIEHVIYRHGPNSGFTNVSKFSQGTSLKNIADMADEAFTKGVRTGNDIVHDFGKVIGNDINGNPTTRIIIHLNKNGEIRTMYPY